MLVFRSIVFNVIFFSIIPLLLILGMPLRFFDKKYTFIFWDILSKITAFIVEKIANISYIVENADRITEAPVIYAIRHESTWETLVLIHKFKKPIFVLKKELLDLPFFGGLSKKVGSIGIDREQGAKALINSARQVTQALEANHQVIIFPEGTRAPTGKHVELKRGIALFYKRNSCPVIPIIHNSGKFWARYGFIKHPGTISVKVMKPIQPGLSANEFMEQLNSIFYQEIENLK